MPGGSQTTSKRPAQFAFGHYPIYATHGRGGHLWDSDGNEYVDFVMALGPITLGYGYPAVDEAIRAQLERGIIYGLLAEVEVEAAEAVVAAVPCAEQVRFLKGGAEATSAAVRIARAYTGRQKVANCGYRGWHDQWTVVNNDGGRRRRRQVCRGGRGNPSRTARAAMNISVWSWSWRIRGEMYAPVLAVVVIPVGVLLKCFVLTLIGGKVRRCQCLPCAGISLNKFIHTHVAISIEKGRRSKRPTSWKS